jgi:hypothetical protein
VQNGFVHHVTGLALRNTTTLHTLQLLDLFAESMTGWPLDGLRVWVRYSRGAAYSGTCYDSEGRVYVNIGRRVQYPYLLHTHVARAVSRGSEWSKPLFTLELADAYQLSLFVYLHECYHWLVRKARRNRRQKESMCDRFATRILVHRFGCVVRNEKRRPADRADWDFQDVERFVSAARRKIVTRAATRPVEDRRLASSGAQLLLFD